MHDPFAAPAADWTRVQPALRLVWLTGVSVVCTVALVCGLLLGIFVTWWAGAPIAILAVLAVVIGAITVTRRVRAIGYHVGSDALWIRHGLMFRKLVVVPYARLQFVDVEAGPLERRFGIATVRLHTASAQTDAHIPGLASADAADLRDELARLGETRSVGL